MTAILWCWLSLWLVVGVYLPDTWSTWIKVLVWWPVTFITLLLMKTITERTDMAVNKCGGCGADTHFREIIETPCGPFCGECYKAHRQECDTCQEAYEEEHGIECECGEIVKRGDPYWSTFCGTFCKECGDEHLEECAICRKEFG